MSIIKKKKLIASLQFANLMAQYDLNYKFGRKINQIFKIVHINFQRLCLHNIIRIDIIQVKVYRSISK